MVMGWDDALIMLGGSALAGGIGLMGQKGGSNNAAAALQEAQMNYLLQKQQMEQQYRLSTAGQTDARGNRTSYDPSSNSWKVDVTPTTQGLIGASDQAHRLALVRNLSSGQNEQSLAMSRRLKAGDVSSANLDALRYGYGAPTKEGVVGANKVAGATNVGENADLLRNAYTMAALRTGTGAVPLQQSLSTLDRGGTAGIRSALASGDANANPLFENAYGQYVNNRLGPATGAHGVSNPDTSFTPENVSAGLSANVRNAFDTAAATGTQGSRNVNAALDPLLTARFNQYTPNYGKFAGGLFDNLQTIYKGMRGGGNSDPFASFDPSTFTGGRSPGSDGM